MEIIRRKNKNKNKSKNKNNYSTEEYDVTYFPCERNLVENQDQIKYLESQIDFLLKEKNEYESQLIKLPEHPKSVNEIKNKKILNNNIELNEKKINVIKAKLRKIKE